LPDVELSDYCDGNELGRGDGNVSAVGGEDGCLSLLGPCRDVARCGMGVERVSEDSGLMIADAVLGVVFGAVTWVVNLFPENTVTFSLPAGAAGLMSWVGEVCNLTALGVACGIIVAGELSLAVFHTVRFIWRILWS